MRLPLATLEIFNAIAREGSLRAAAQALGLKPSTVSHQLKNLEQQLDTPLFIRTTRSVSMTEAGRALARSTAPAFDQLGEGLLLTSEFEGWEQRGAIEVLLRLQQASWITRTWGDCYGYLLVATGRALAMIDPQMNIWDAAAVQPILDEAGGIFSDWQGNPTIASGEGIGANRQVLNEILAVTRGLPHREKQGGKQS